MNGFEGFPEIDEAREGFDVWDAWSSTGSTYKAITAKQVWKSIKVGKGIGLGTLITRAKAAGWTDSKTYKKPTRAEIEERRKKAEERARQAAEQEALQHAAAAERALAIWEAATPAETHAYLKRKGVASHGLRIGRWEIVNDETGEVRLVTDKALLIPIRDRQRNLWSLQAIFPNDKNLLRRDKDYLKDGAKAGRFFPIGGKPLQRDDGWEQTPDEVRMPFKMLKSAGIVPHEVELIRERAALRQRLAAATTDDDIRSAQQALAQLELTLALRMESLRR